MENIKSRFPPNEMRSCTERIRWMYGMNMVVLS